MSLLNNVLFVIHILAVVGILTLLLLKNLKAPHKLNAGVLHSAATALLAGAAMVAIRYPLHNQDPKQYPLFNMGFVGVKLGIVFLILAIGYMNVKKPSISKPVWLTMILLTIANIVIAGML